MRTVKASEVREGDSLNVHGATLKVGGIITTEKVIKFHSGIFVYICEPETEVQIND